MQQSNVNYSDPGYADFISAIKCKKGVNPLSDDELITLALDEISHTFTREERDYS